MGQVFSVAMSLSRKRLRGPDLIAHAINESGAGTTTASKRPRVEITASPTSSSLDKFMIVGLGNPGAQYDNTRHNIGFAILDEIAQRYGLPWNKKLESKAQIAEGIILGRKVILVKPMTFMNNSGESVRPLGKKFGIPLSNLLVIYDDLDLPTGKIRFRGKGGHGGHNGMRSIIAQNANSQDFPRIKVGIGRPPAGGMPVPAWVLGRFTKDETPLMEQAAVEAIDAMEAVLTLGVEKASSGQRLN